MSKVTVLGAGAWGSALALTSSRAGHTITVWGRNIEKLQSLPRIPHWLSSIHTTSVLQDALTGADFLIYALPAQTFRNFFTHYPLSCPTVIASKGLELESGFLLSEIAHQEKWPDLFSFLAGPHLASEVTLNLPTAGVLAGTQDYSYLLHHDMFKLSSFQDVIGVQVASALKNVAAIIGGIARGALWGDNACAALLTQSFEEMRIFGQALGADPDTFMTQAGLGDFMLSAWSLKARNTQFGIRFARGENPDPYEPLAEGFFTVQAVVKRAHTLELSLPLIETLASLLTYPFSQPTLSHLLKVLV